MSTSIAERALARIDEERIVRLLCRLIDTPSPTGEELACAEVLAEHLRQVGVTAELQRFYSDRANVIGRVPGRGAGIRLMFCGHLDTSGRGDPEYDYPAYGMLGPGDLPRAIVEDGIVYGLGAFNMKGGLAAAAEALTVLVEADTALAGEVLLGAVAGESEKAPVRGALRDYRGPAYEGGGVGAAWLLQHSRRPDAVVICEPSDLWVVNAQPGYLQLKITFHGRALYQAARRPQFPGVSAIDLAWHAIQALRNWEGTYRARYQLACGMGTLHPNVTVGAIESGWPFKPTMTPAICQLYVDLRVPPHLDAEAAVRELEGVIGDTLAGTGGSFEVAVFGSNVPGALVPLEHPLMQAALTARNTVLGYPQERHPDEHLAPGDDGKLFASFGIPYVKCGPGGLAGPGEKHLGREWVDIHQVVQAARIYVLMALDIAARDRSEIDTWPSVKRLPRDFSGKQPDASSRGV
jgi:acetylornithine deacetylase